MTFEVAGSASAATVVVVNSTGDGPWDSASSTVCETAPGNGVCTLRAAFTVADMNPGTVIDFSIPGAGSHSITPAGPLPVLTQPVTVNGATQPGYAGVPLIELSGGSAGPFPGIELLGGNSTVRGLDIDRWGTSGILIESNGNTIAGNYVGLAPDGQTAAGNATSGVLIIGGSDNIVGGTTALERNVISGNGDKGVQIQRATPSSVAPATGNVVEGNYVGTNATGDAPLANALDGISLVWAAQGNTIGGSAPGAGNLVSGNGRIGISVFDTSAHTLIDGNYVGTNAAGTAALHGNPECGIVLISADNTVGGTSSGARNVISGNGGGCGLTSGAQPIQTGPSGSNVIQGNYIGPNATDTAPLGNGNQLSDVEAGLAIQSPNNQIGGTAVGAGNVIAGNVGPGLWFDTTSAQANAVQGNFIGTDSTRTLAFGNSGDGVLFTGGAHGNTIGGTAPGEGNTIANNVSNGVEVSGAAGDAVEGNSISANALGIALISGGNDNATAPAVVSALSNGRTTTIAGRAEVGQRVEIFANANCNDPEGAEFLGSTVSPSENWSLTVPAVGIGNGITATVTNLLTNDTSQFSSCRANDYPRINSPLTSRWSVHATYSTVRALAVRALPAGATVGVRCNGRGCPLRRRTIRARPHRNAVTLTSLFARAHLRPGATVELDIAAPDSIGEVVRYAIRPGRIPSQIRLCLPPGHSHAVACYLT